MARQGFWTPERIDEIRRFYNLEWTSAQIAAHFGTTIEAVRKQAYKHKVTSRDRHAFIQSQRMKGRKESAATRRKKSVVMKARHQDPVFRAKILASGALACKQMDRQKAADTRRGFRVPPELWDEYQILRRKMRSSQEAGRILGLIPSSTSQERRA